MPKTFYDLTIPEPPPAQPSPDINEFMDYTEEMLEGLFSMLLSLSMILGRGDGR